MHFRVLGEPLIDDRWGLGWGHTLLMTILGFGAGALISKPCCW